MEVVILGVEAVGGHEDDHLALEWERGRIGKRKCAETGGDASFHFNSRFHLGYTVTLLNKWNPDVEILIAF